MPSTAPSPASRPPAAPRPSASPPPASPSRRALLAAGLPAVLALGAVGVVGSPRPAVLGDPTGDTALADALAPRLDGHRRVAVALLEAGTNPRFAGFGTDQQGEFEIGSVSKTFTAALLLSAVADGALGLQDTVADVLGSDAEGTAIGDRTLAELASHTAGLPGLPPQAALRNLWASPLRKNPYAGISGPDIIRAALAAEPTEPGTFAYSNFSVALEGWLTARALGATWQDALASRLLQPLGLTRTRAPRTPAELGEDAPLGHVADGRRCAAWVQDGIAPAGGIRSTAGDLALWLRSMIDGTNPGAQGLDPVAPTGEDQSIGINWFTSRLPTGDDMTWHNGMTGGFASFVGWNRATGRGVVLLTDTARNLDDLALEILAGEVAA